MTTPFWKAVRELAALRKHIPPERRALSGVRAAFARDMLNQPVVRTCECETPYLERWPTHEKCRRCNRLIHPRVALAACPSCTHTECACDCSTCVAAATTTRQPCACYTCARHRRDRG